MSKQQTADDKQAAAFTDLNKVRAKDHIRLRLALVKLETVIREIRYELDDDQFEKDEEL